MGRRDTGGWQETSMGAPAYYVVESRRGCGLGSIIFFSGVVLTASAAVVYAVPEARSMVTAAVGGVCPESFSWCADEAAVSSDGGAPEPVMSRATLEVPRSVEELNSPPQTIEDIAAFHVVPASQGGVQVDEAGNIGVEVKAEFFADKFAEAGGGVEADGQAYTIVPGSEARRTFTIEKLLNERSVCIFDLTKALEGAQTHPAFMLDSGAPVTAEQLQAAEIVYEINANAADGGQEDDPAIPNLLAFYRLENGDIQTIESCEVGGQQADADQPGGSNPQ